MHDPFVFVFPIINSNTDSPIIYTPLP
jgi:hypothetical protein